MNLADLTPAELHALRPQVGAALQERIDGMLEQRQPSRRWASDPGLSEKEIQRRVHLRLTELGVAVYWLSQPRASKQTPGLSDLLCFCPVRGLFFVETKAAGGVQSEAQQKFQGRCRIAGVPYILGGLTEVEAFLQGNTPADTATPCTRV